MFPRSFLISVFFLVFYSETITPVFADATAEQEAISVAGAWLNLVDQGRYSDSWQQAASSFQATVNKEQWATSLQAIRQSLGKVISRKLNRKQYTHTLPGAPDGEYVVLEFYTVFEMKKNAVETVTPMLNSDGQWKVSGYYIR